MTFIEATSSGKNFRHPDMEEGCYFGFKDDELREFFHDGGNSFPCFTHRDFTRGDWEFFHVPEVIKVGDTVRWGESVHEFTVLAGFDGIAVLQNTVDLHHIEGMRGSKPILLADLTLIRKGNVHVFEGVEVIEQNGHVYTVMKGSYCHPMGYLELKGNGKTYTMTLKEETDGK